MSAKLVSIIGPPAVGKTTLAEQLAKLLPARLVREDYAGNPFLAGSYTGTDAARLPGQLYFLISRVGQLSRLTWPSDGVLVSDYGFCQDAIYARARLTGDDLRMYEGLAGSMAGLVHAPDVMIILDASEATLAERIHRRGRGFEQGMSPEFLGAMRQAYRDERPRIACPVISVDCDAVDLMAPGPVAQLAGRVKELLESGNGT